ncbi:polynucleotide 5'-hydroxyl-kinase GRC3/NOL9 [Metschnikowia aff. pulcherrima]|uniref:Polynucleotide 5'-hydroxyl-kinase GRC3 n=1 Tax=Metschnikowia aff. pulcherrima TaxID=2163413 RepID=A0A4P6XV97_9ASCO|nr:polynucleotide 5'-hydroxyl-kinase GRC3/NOL9 [Metschnikowia aff. pulcherrima]
MTHIPITHVFYPKVPKKFKLNAMSAFAALGKQRDVQEYCYPHPVAKLLAGPVESSNFTFTIDNSVFAPSSIFIGLLPSEYLVVKGLYQLKVHRGICLLNNVHEIPRGTAFPVVTSSAESLPTLSAPEKDHTLLEEQLSDNKTLLFPQCSTVIELSNWKIGLQDLCRYSPLLENLYYSKDTQYTFEFVLGPEESTSAIFFDPHSLRTLNGVCRQMETVVVFGVPNGGKKTFAKAIINNMVLAGRKPVAYLDLDPGSIDSDAPGCLSLRVVRKAILGEVFFWTQEQNEEDLHRYYGFTSFADRPHYYTRLCHELLAHYKQHLEHKGIPLVVKYPCWIKGYGKELLMEFSRALNPKKMVYLTHNNAVSLEDFEIDAFEETDHPDYEVLAGFQHRDCSIVRGVRRDRGLTKNELLFRNKLLYFHQAAPGQSFDFKKPILHTDPVKLSFDHISAISVLQLEAYPDMTREDVYTMVEATIMAIFTVKSSSLQFSELAEKIYMSGSELTELDATFVGLCMVHLVDKAHNSLNVYLRDKDEVSRQLIKAKEQGHSIVLARGDGQIPTVEFTNGLSGKEPKVPYVSYTPMQKLGGIWKVRRNIGRKNQG